jgi:hypothetical protein
MPYLRPVPYFVAVVLVVNQVTVNFHSENQNHNRLIYNFGSAMLNTVPENALILTRGDIYINSLRYLQECEGLRQDVKVIDLEQLKTEWMHQLVSRHYPDIALPEGPYQPDVKPGDKQYYGVVDIIDANIDRMPIYVNLIKKHSELSWDDKYEAIPEGLAYRVLYIDAPFDIDSYFESSAKAFDSLCSDSFLVKIRPGSWEHVVRQAYCQAQDARAEYLLKYGQSSRNYSRILHTARQIVREIIQLDADHPPLYYKNLGIICFRLRGSDPNAEKEMIAAWQEYLRIGPRDDPQLPDIRRELTRALEHQHPRDLP